MSDYLETIGNGTTFGTVKKEQNEYLYVVFRTHYFVSKPTVFETSKKPGKDSCINGAVKLFST